MMSGGHFDYAYQTMHRFADELQNELKNAGKVRNSYGLARSAKLDAHRLPNTRSVVH